MTLRDTLSRSIVVAGLALVSASWTLPTAAAAADWPEWRGAGRLGLVEDDSLVETLPAAGLPVAWRRPVHGGYAGPAVAEQRVFVTDFETIENLRGTERALALDEASGRVLWQRQWPTHYRGLEPRYALGPRATPTVDGDRVYVLGAMGNLLALQVADGAVLWQKDFVAEYGTDVPVWGMSGAPIVYGNLLIALVGGSEGALVVAFDKMSGVERWRALDTVDPDRGDEPGYGQPILIEAGGVTQLVIWHPGAVTSLDPRTGEQHWQLPKAVSLGLTVATPVFDGKHLLVSSFFRGSSLMALDANEPRARILWQGRSESEVDTDGLHALISTPVIDGDTIYGVGSYGQLRALDLATGKRLWESLDAVGEKARWASAFIVRHGDRYLLSNDRGELIIASLDRKGYHERSRTKLIEPTSPASRRTKGAVHWSHPAYANGHIIVRNDREILRADLRRATAKPPVAKSMTPGGGTQSIDR